MAVKLPPSNPAGFSFRTFSDRVELAKGLSYIPRGLKASYNIGSYIAVNQHEIFKTACRPIIYSKAFDITVYSDLKLVNRYLVKIKDVSTSDEFDGAVFKKGTTTSQEEIAIRNRSDFESFSTKYDEYITIYRKK